MPRTCRRLISASACVLLASMSAASIGQATKPPTSSGDDPSLHIRWSGVIGEDKNTPNEVYCLMGSGFIMAPTSRNINQLVSIWIAKHPQARVVRVSTSGPIMVDQPDSVQTYVWLVEGQNSLNEYLVRRGACPGGTMVMPDYSNLSPKSGRTGKTPFHFRVFVSAPEYNSFLKIIEQSEAKAQKEKLGIWKNGTEDVY